MNGHRISIRFVYCAMLILWNEQRAIRCVDYSKDIDTRIVHVE